MAFKNTDETLSIAEIDAHIKKYEGKVLKRPKSMAGASEERLQLFDVCGKYQVVRPILRFVRGLLFFKPKWQKVLDDAMSSLDAVCVS